MTSAPEILIGRITAACLVAAAMMAPAQAQVGAAHGVPAVAPVMTPAAAMAPAAAAKPVAPSPAATPAESFACGAPTEFLHLNYTLHHTAQRLAADEPLTIVAIGSSSTSGSGASSAAASYPSRLAVELKERFPDRDITVLNRGVAGEETEQMMARFAKDVIPAHPDLVIWQVGTNSVLRDHPLKPHWLLLREGIAELKATGADVVLMDMQYAPQVLAKPETPGMEEQIALAAKGASVDLFGRFAVMRQWYEVQHIPFATFISADNLHMNDWGYACVAKLLAAAISEAATRPTADPAPASGTNSLSRQGPMPAARTRERRDESIRVKSLESMRRPAFRCRPVRLAEPFAPWRASRLLSPLLQGEGNAAGYTWVISRS